MAWLCEIKIRNLIKLLLLGKFFSLQNLLRLARHQAVLFIHRNRLSTRRPCNLILLLMIRILPPHILVHLSQRSVRFGRHVTHHIAQHCIAVAAGVLASGRLTFVEEGRCSRFELTHIVNQLLLQTLIEVLLRL